MLHRKSIISLFACCLFAIGVEAQVVDYGQANGVFSFENDTEGVTTSSHSSVSISDEHSKLGHKSLKWEWKRKGSSMSINAPVPYLAKNPNPKETSVSSFVFWIYSPKPLDGQLHFSFMKDGKECSWFDYQLGFTGWRGAWVAFDRDMEGTPLEDMDEVRITASKDLKRGELYFDGIITASFQDVRYHTADWQARFINKETTNFWLTLNQFWDNELDIYVEDREMTEQEIADCKVIENRFIELVTDGVKPLSIDEIRKIYDAYNIRFNEDGTINGLPIWFIRYGETYLNQGIPDAMPTFTARGQTLRQLNDAMLKIAVTYMQETDPAVKAEIAQIYVNLTKHLLDQGFAVGSGQGTLHHLGYSMRNFYTAPVIMKSVLKEAGLAGQMQMAMEWFCGAGEVRTAPEQLGMDIDAFNTSLMGRFGAVIMLNDDSYKHAYFTALSRWVDNGFKYTDGTNPAFKRDGTVVHHRKCYPEYAIGGFKGSVNAIWMLAGTQWAISQESHEIQKNALMTMRFYSQLKSFPLAMSGRHPDGTRSLIPSQFALLADAGSPDGSQAIDKDLAEAYLRINGTSGKWGEKFTAAGLVAENAPVGGKYLPYNCSLSYRQGGWLLTFAGHSRYLWAAETYQRENHYGRYLTHGSMQLLCGKDSFESGYQLAGWDWCHIPGTTAAAIPMEQMKANVLNVDEFSGYEEMLLSDEWFAGGVSFGTDAAMYSMKLHEHDKYNGSLRARKSFFAFGNRIVCIGDGLENSLEGSELHTTLFQNAIAADDVCDAETFESESIVLGDKFGNAYFVRNAKVCLTKGLQHSFHEETDAPTEGYFERAYIDHGAVCTGSEADCYEYMVVIAPTKTDVDLYEAQRPYDVLRADATAHIVKDQVSGITGCAAFETVSVDENIVSLSPSVMMYSMTEDSMQISVSNPDLALYLGESDEEFDNDGKRKERSVYGRKWITNPAYPTTVKIVVNGQWNVSGDCEMTVEHETGNTIITIVTAECRTENIKLNK